MNTATNGTTAKPLRSPPQPSACYSLSEGEKSFSNNNSYVPKANGVSISTSIICIIIYGSVFYIFDLSPSLVFNSTKFWFFLTNTLIIIIAADYGSFSASSDKADDPYDQYVARSRPTLSPIHHQYHYAYYNTSTQPASSPPHLDNSSYHEDKEVEQETEEEVVDMSIVPTQDSIWESISKDNDAQLMPKFETNIDHEDCIYDEKKVTKFRRTKSEKVARIDERKNVMHRWESARHEPVTEIEDDHLEQEYNEGDKGNEFAAMTDEELNQRVEEFIQKFNRQIRLERDTNF